MRKEKKNIKAKKKRKEKKRRRKRKQIERKRIRREKEGKGKGKISRLSSGRSSTVRGLKLVHAAQFTCGHKKVGVLTNSVR